MDSMSAIILTRTDTTLDLSQKAEKGWRCESHKKRQGRSQSCLFINITMVGPYLFPPQTPLHPAPNPAPNLHPTMHPPLVAFKLAGCQSPPQPFPPPPTVWMRSGS
jgi:hypothetical protein